MKVPRDIGLSSWIRQLAKDGRLYRFYKTEEWLALREQVLRDHHHECAMCKAKTPAVYTRAAHVHHVNEVKDRPELALSRTYRDAEGVHDNLLPLCIVCHNVVHDRHYTGGPSKTPLNEERW